MLGTAVLSAGTPQQAQAVRQAYESKLEAWKLRMQLAKTQAAREELAAEAPDPKKAARDMWSVIGGSMPGEKDGGGIGALDKEWAIEPMAWFLQVARQLAQVGADGIARPLAAGEMTTVRRAVEAYHLKSAKLAPMCMALVACGDPDSQALLRKIEKTNPSKEVSGVAALGIAMTAKGIGDDAKVMRERLTMLRKAIVDAADVEINGTTVAELAEEELYIIMNLSKGVVAPDLVGVNSNGAPMKLSDFAGKVLILLFWNSGGDGPDAILEMVRAIREDERFAGKAFEVVGVNSDPPQVLKKLQTEHRIDWPNFSDPQNRLGKEYRVGGWPLAYVLGPDRQIHYVGNMGTFVELTAYAVLTGD